MRPIGTLMLALTSLLAAPPAAQAFAPGEETVFDISYLNLHTGEGRILVGRPESLTIALNSWPQ